MLVSFLNSCRADVQRGTSEVRAENSEGGTVLEHVAHGQAWRILAGKKLPTSYDDGDDLRPACCTTSTMMTPRRFWNAYRALEDNGRFIFYEPCYLVWQSGISAYFMSLDGGRTSAQSSNGRSWRAHLSGRRRACFAPT